MAAASIVVVAKCPIPGQSKTRLIPVLGEEGSAALAKSMLADVLTVVTDCVSINNHRLCCLLHCCISEMTYAVLVLSIRLWDGAR